MTATAATLAGLFGAFVGYLVGLHKGRQIEREHQRALDRYAETTREQMTDEIRNLSDADLDQRLDKWMRNH